MEKKKLQVALYWGAGCGGCDVAVLDTNEFILELAAAADIRLWPIAVDAKYKDVEAMADGELDLTIFNGAIRNSENEHIAKLLRRKSKLVVAFGSCAHLGGIPALANLATKEEIFERAYLKNPSIEEGNTTVPQTHTRVNGGELTIPEFYKRVYKLNDVVDVDLFVPGCPPAPEQVKAVLKAVAGGLLPPKGSVVGASERAVCDDCQAEEGRKEGQAVLPAVADPPGSRAVPDGTGNPLRRDRRPAPGAGCAARTATCRAAAATARCPMSWTRVRSC